MRAQVKSAHEAKLQLEADNMALYGKIRYLQTYGTQRSAPVKVGRNISYLFYVTTDEMY